MRMKKRNLIFVIGLLINLPFQAISQGNQNVSFIHITDTHICNLVGYHPYFIQKRMHYGEGIKPLSNFFKTIPAREKADFVVLTGDMIDFYEAEDATGEMRGAVIELFTKFLDASDVPVYLTLGNHDIASYWVNSESSYTSYQLNAVKARATWTRNAGCFRNGTYYSRTCQVGPTMYRLIFLDNGYYAPSLAREETGCAHLIDPFQLYWLENELSVSDQDVEIIFMHIPLPGIEKEDGSQIQTIEVNSVKSGCDLFEALGKHASVKAIFAGHKHRNILCNLKYADGHTLVQVETGAFARENTNWRVVHLTPDRILISSPSGEKIQHSITLK